MPDPSLPPMINDVPLITASNFQVAFNAAEFITTMAYTAMDRLTGNLEHRVSYSVTSSPQAARDLHAALGKALADYERMYGPIPGAVPIVDEGGRLDGSGGVVSLFGRGVSPRDSVGVHTGAVPVCDHGKPAHLPCVACAKADAEQGITFDDNDGPLIAVCDSCGSRYGEPHAVGCTSPY